MLFRFFFFLSLFPSPPPDSSHPRSDHPSPSATPMDSLFFRSFLYLMLSPNANRFVFGRRFRFVFGFGFVRFNSMRCLYAKFYCHSANVRKCVLCVVLARVCRNGLNMSKHAHIHTHARPSDRIEVAAAAAAAFFSARFLVSPATLIPGAPRRSQNITMAMNGIGCE